MLLIIVLVVIGVTSGSQSSISTHNDSNSPTPLPTGGGSGSNNTPSPTNNRAPATAPTAPTRSPTPQPFSKQTVVKDFVLSKLGSQGHFPEINYFPSPKSKLPPKGYVPSKAGYSAKDMASSDLPGLEAPQLTSSFTKASQYEVCDKCTFKDADRVIRYEFVKHPMMGSYDPPVVPEFRPPQKLTDFTDFGTSSNGPSGASPKATYKYPEPEIRDQVQRHTYDKPYFVPYSSKSNRQVLNHMKDPIKGVIPMLIFSPQYSDKKNPHENVENIIKSWYEYNSRGIIRFVGVDGTDFPTNVNIHTYLKFNDATGGKAKGFTEPYYEWLGGWDMTGVGNAYWLRAFNHNFGTPGNGGGNTIHLGNQGTRHTRHETGHALGLGHSCALPRFKNNRAPAFQDKIVGRKVPADLKSQGYAKTNYGDSLSSFMADGPSEALCAPQFHRVGFAQPDEVVYLRPGYRYRLRAAQAAEQLTQFAIVMIEPVTGNRVWFSYVNKASKKQKYIATHVTSTMATSGRTGLPNYRFELDLISKAGDKVTDETGVVLEVVAIDDSYIDVDVTFDATKAFDRKPPTVDIKQTRKNDDSVDVSVTIKNPNPNNRRPFILFETTSSKCANRAKILMNKVYYPKKTSGTKDGILIDDLTYTYEFTLARNKGDMQQAAAFHIYDAIEYRFTVDFSGNT